jgi:hypothetical protein
MGRIEVALKVLRATRTHWRLAVVSAGMACTLAFPVATASVASASIQKPSKTLPPICRYLNDQAGSAKFLLQVGNDFKARDVPGLKALFLNLVSSEEKLSTSSAVKSAPANIQAAIKTVAHSMPAIKAQIDKAGTMLQLEAVLTSMGKAPGVQGAENVLNKYADAVCGG